MVFRSCFCYKKCPSLSTKRTITHVRNLLTVKPKYPGVLIQQYVPQRLSMSTVTIGNKIEKIEIPNVIQTMPSNNFEQVLNKQLTSKQTKGFYRRLAKRNPTEIFNLFIPKLDTIDYTQLRPIFLEAASYWPIETIQEIMLLCNDNYVPFRIDLLQLLQSSYVKSKNLNDLLQVLPKSGELKDMLPFYNNVLNKCLKQKQYDHMYKVIKLMEERNIEPDIATCNILLRMQLRNCKKPEDSFEIYKDIINEGGKKPNYATFNTLIKYTCDVQQWNMLSTWLDLMEKEGLEPNPITVRILFKSYVEYPSSKEIIEAFERVSKAVPLKGREKLLNTGISRLLKLNQTKAAMDLLEKTFSLNEPLSLYSYNLLLQTLCLDGKIEEAEIILNSMVSQNDKNIPEPDIISFTTLIHGFIRNNQHINLDQISNMYKKLLNQGLQSNNVLQSVILYGLIRSNHNNNNLSKIKSMFDLILNTKDNEILPRKPTDKPLNEMMIYNMMMDFYFLHYHHSKELKNQIPKEPFALLQDAVESKKLKPTVSTLNILVRGLAILNKDLNAAEKIVDLLKEKGVEIDEKTVWYLTNSAYKQGQISRARQWIELFESKNKSIQGSGLKNLKSILTKWES